ncbi:TrmH family RNA methyltransferase [Rasiella rasia]|uniref:TrmH family RNA methyltransferase n=1 Tax=Rasiella rasia TaxID=2744027 RepID=A0A6G6GIQ6_9FLAO|nr:TrmH family RNA methyltransferase [Rasiella rasia]QIE58476.1 TrmH family RNA methyltransferase [Rasiella rasia]
MLQHNHKSTPFSEEKNDLILVCDNLQSPANIGAIFRLCDAFGVKKILSNVAFDMSSNRLKRTSRNTEKHIPFEITESLPARVVQLQQQGYVTIALEIATASIALPNLSLQSKQKIVLIIGNEKHGVSEELLSISDITTHIQMYGQNSSMNVAQATAIALYELTKH